MASSPYIRALRARIGRGLVLLPSVAAVIHDPDGRLLLQRKPGAEGWSLPAGGIEPGESPEDALRREVLEEIGRAVRTARLLDVVGGKAYRHSDPNGDRVEYTVVLFRCTLKHGPAHPTGPETRALRFFARDAMPPLALPYPDALLF
ncbi:MAG: NUDIX domain-containing protein [Maritimibacter sp.]|nr:NUDIX domain-containing protein [Maritimibacter sp.]